VAAVATKVGQKGLEILFVGRRGTLGVRAERESLTGDLGWPVRVGEKEGGERRGETLTCGLGWQREKESARAGEEPGLGRMLGRVKRRERRHGSGWPMEADCGRWKQGAADVEAGIGRWEAEIGRCGVS
jgi:hypothetical protein